MTVSLAMTDDLSGANYIYVTFTSPSGGGGWAYFAAGQGSGESGSFEVSFPKFIEPGTWTVGVYVRDALGNSRTYSAAGLSALGFPTTLVVHQ